MSKTKKVVAEMKYAKKGRSRRKARAGRCEALCATRRGKHEQCTRDATYTIAGADLCNQHTRVAEKVLGRRS